MWTGRTRVVSWWIGSVEPRRRETVCSAPRIQCAVSTVCSAPRIRNYFQCSQSNGRVARGWAAAPKLCRASGAASPFRRAPGAGGATRMGGGAAASAARPGTPSINPHHSFPPARARRSAGEMSRVAAGVVALVECDADPSRFPGRSVLTLIRTNGLPISTSCKPLLFQKINPKSQLPGTLALNRPKYKAVAPSRFPSTP